MDYDVALVTQKEYIQPAKRSAYINNVLQEDQLVQDALEKLGLHVKRVAWDDTSFNWKKTKVAVIRATWDYFYRFSEFSAWLENVSATTQLINCKALLQWNTNKIYLLELQEKGIQIPETFVIKKGSCFTLQELHELLGWEHTILKPCISGAARHTYNLNKNNLAEHESIFTKLQQTEALLLQPFQHRIVTHGEISLIYFNGIFTHAVLKKAKKGDFRVQDDFGGSVFPYQPNAKEIAFAKKCIEACNIKPIYARVDVFLDNNNQLALGELELIEPELWFRLHPEAATIFAQVILEKLEKQPPFIYLI